MKRSIVFSALFSAISLYSLPSHASGIIKGESSYISSDYAKTKYPIVLTHGFFGFTRLGLKSFGIDYWYQMAPDLAKNGATVFATQVSPVNSTEIRGEQLLQQVDEVLALTGATKVNLIGHSHGGPTNQYIEFVAPEKVASVTAIAGVMKGTPVADTLISSSLLNPLVKIVVGNILAPAITNLEGNPSLSIDYDKSIYSLSTKGATEFNAKFPTAAIPKDCNSEGQKVTSNGIYHYSWIGSSQITNPLDLIDTVVLGVTSLMIPGQKNDGLVPVCSAKYGQVIRNNYNLNHFDEINQVMGIRGLFSQDPVQILREHANRLKLEGL